MEVNSKAKSACKKEGIEWAAWGRDKGGKTNEVRAFIKVESILVLSSVFLNLSSRNSKTQQKHKEKTALAVFRNYDNFPKSLKGGQCYLCKTLAWE